MMGDLRVRGKVHSARGRWCAGVNILGTGAGLPVGRVSNAELIQRNALETSAEWVVSKTGIERRRVAEAGVRASDLATEAALTALERSGITPQDVELFIVATSTPDYTMPATACLLQRNLCARRAMAFDVVNACNGFVTAFDVAVRYFQTGVQTALVVGVDLGTRLVNPADRLTSIFFGDGAGAVVLGTGGSGRVLASQVYSEGDDEPLSVPVGGTMQMDGKAIWQFATRVFPETVRQLCAEAGILPREIDWLIPHQANRNILLESASQLGIPEDRVVINIDQYGNTMAGSVPIALDELYRKRRVQPGDRLLLLGFGAGLSWGGVLLEV